MSAATGVLALLAAGVPLFLTGMFTGIAGVAVLTAGTFAAAVLQRAGLTPASVRGLYRADGHARHDRAATQRARDGDGRRRQHAVCRLCDQPVRAVAALRYLRASRRSRGTPTRRRLPSAGETAAHGSPAQSARRSASLSILGVILFWAVIRYRPSIAFDPSIPLVLVIGGLSGLFMLSGRGWSEVARQVFSGTPLMLAAVLVAVGVLVQIMALTGVRGWLVIQAMSFQSPWIYGALAGLPLLGSVLTSIGVSNSLGVPFAFAFIHQDMILNISALSAMAALSEFCPPTAISTALAAYVVGTDRLWPIIRAALPTLVCLTALAVLMLIFSPALAPYLR